MSSGEPAPTTVPRSLPRGRSHLPREVVLVSQRERLIEAVIAVIGAKGYATATIADVIRAARVSRSTFYAQFRDKEEAFLAAYEQRASQHLARVVRSAGRQPAPMACLQTGVRAYLEALAGDAAYARTAVVEVLAAGERAGAARDTVHRRYARLLASWHHRIRQEQPAVPAIPDELFAGAVGGVSDLVAAEIRAGRAEQLPRLAPVTVTLLLNVAAVPAGREVAAALAASRANRR